MNHYNKEIIKELEKDLNELNKKYVNKSNELNKKVQDKKNEHDGIIDKETLKIQNTINIIDSHVLQQIKIIQDSLSYISENN